MAKRYFKGTTNYEWLSAGNWYTNPQCTIKAGSLPTIADDVFVLSDATETLRNSSDVLYYNSLSASNSRMYFYKFSNASFNIGVTVSAIFTGNSIFGGSSLSALSCYFFDNSYTAGTGYQAYESYTVKPYFFNTNIYLYNNSSFLSNSNNCNFYLYNNSSISTGIAFGDTNVYSTNNIVLQNNIASFNDNSLKNSQDTSFNSYNSIINVNQNAQFQISNTYSTSSIFIFNNNSKILSNEYIGNTFNNSTIYINLTNFNTFNNWALSLSNKSKIIFNSPQFTTGTLTVTGNQTLNMTGSFDTDVINCAFTTNTSLPLTAINFNNNSNYSNFFNFFNNTTSLKINFYDNSYNNGYLVNNSFYGNTYNNGSVVNAYFYNSSYNTGQVGNGTFYGNSYNSGYVNLTGVFNENSSNRFAVNDIIFNDNSYSQTDTVYDTLLYNNRISKGIKNTNILGLVSNDNTNSIIKNANTFSNFSFPTTINYLSSNIDKQNLNVVQSNLIFNIDLGNTYCYFRGKNAKITVYDISGKGNDYKLLNPIGQFYSISDLPYSRNNGGYALFQKEGRSEFYNINNPILTVSSVDIWFNAKRTYYNYNYSTLIKAHSSFENYNGREPEWSIYAMDKTNMKFAPAYWRNVINIPMSSFNDKWVNCTMVRNSADFCCVYLNGVFNSRISVTGATLTNNQPIALDGSNASFWDNGGIPKIAAVKVYDKNLTAEEVLQNYNALKSRFV
jgi:hypothetical protein